MKKFILAASLLLISFNSSAEPETQSKGMPREFACYITEENEVPTDRKDIRFVVHIDPAGGSYLKYQHHVGDGHYGRLNGIYGCDNMTIIKNDDEGVELIDQDGGEEGQVEFSLPSMEGEVYFYMEKMGYGERSLLAIKCVNREFQPVPTSKNKKTMASQF